MLSRRDGDALATTAQSSQYLVESYCFYRFSEPIHFFLYPSDQALHEQFRMASDETDPKHREYHVVYSPGMDLLPALCTQAIADLQDKLNRHAGANWVPMSLAVAITGQVKVEPDSGGAAQTLDCDDAVRALLHANNLIKLEFCQSDQLSNYASTGVRAAEMGSFLRWVHGVYGRDDFQQIVTQPNIELVLNETFDHLQTDWLQSLSDTTSLISKPGSADNWASNLPDSQLSTKTEPEDILKQGLQMYLGGQPASGMREIYRAIEMDSGMGLGYYSLGWIAFKENRYDDAEQQLTKAVMLFDTPEQVAWCHVFRADLYQSATMATCSGKFEYCRNHDTIDRGPGMGAGCPHAAQSYYESSADRALRPHVASVQRHAAVYACLEPGCEQPRRG